MSKSKNKTPVPLYQSLARLQQMLSLRNLAERSREAYLVYVQKLALHFGRDPLELEEAQARAYLIYLKEKRNYAPSSMRTVCAALRFFYQFVGERDWKLFDLVRSPSAQTLPAVLTREEVQRLIGCVREERFRVVLTLIYACGLRVGRSGRAGGARHAAQADPDSCPPRQGSEGSFRAGYRGDLRAAAEMVAATSASEATLPRGRSRVARASRPSERASQRGHGRSAHVHRFHPAVRARGAGGGRTEGRGPCAHAAPLSRPPDYVESRMRSPLKTGRRRSA
jgi:hypothetical protein